MTKRVLIHANDLEVSQAAKDELSTLLSEAGIAVVSGDESPDYIISIGGDGTFITAFQKYKDLVSEVYFIGVHTGSLGFYTDWLASQIPELVEALKQDKQESISYPLLDIQVELNNGNVKETLALNELAIRSIRHTMVCDIYISDSFFETFRGDGLCVSTPTGSTGLNKSLGGAVIHPSLNVMQMTEIAPINNRVYRPISSPIILGSSDIITLVPSPKNDAVDLTIGTQYYSDLNIKSINLKVSDKRIHFAGFRHTSFWDRVRHSFIGEYKQEKD